MSGKLLVSTTLVTPAASLRLSLNTRFKDLREGWEQWTCSMVGTLLMSVVQHGRLGCDAYRGLIYKINYSGAIGAYSIVVAMDTTYI